MNDYEKLLYKSNKQKRQLGILIKKITYYKQELQRKDNIINELKKEISNFDNFKIYYGNKNANSFITLGAKYYNDYILDKIKELEKM